MLNMSDQFAHALGRGVNVNVGVQNPSMLQQLQQQQQQGQQSANPNAMNQNAFQQQQQQQQQSLAQQQHQHQQLAAASLHQRMQQQQQQGQSGPQQPNFQSVSQSQQRLNVGVSPLPGLRHQVIGSMNPPPQMGGTNRSQLNVGMQPPQQSPNVVNVPNASPFNQSLSQNANSSQQQQQQQQQLQSSSQPNPSLLNLQHGGFHSGSSQQANELMQNMIKQQQQQQQGYGQHPSLSSLGGLSVLNGPVGVPPSHTSLSDHGSQQTQQQQQQQGNATSANSNLPRFDMSDFPALSDLNMGMNMMNMNEKGGMNSMLGGSVGVSNLGPSTGQLSLGSTLAGQLSLNQQHQLNNAEANFVIQNEDFPALGGGSNTRRPNASMPTTTSGQSNVTAASLLQQRAVGASSTGSGAIGQTAPASGTSQSQPPSSVSLQQPSSLSPAPNRSAAARPPKATSCDKFGLTGLLSVIRMTDPDLNTLALGTDLTTLGLNLNSSEVLYATFSAPCLEVPTRAEPDYVLPSAYYTQPPALKTSHLAKFTLETLFYIFYNMPKDTLQVYAAKELYKREWRYHKELKLWFSRASSATPPNSNTPAPGVTDASGKKVDGGLSKGGDSAKDGKDSKDGSPDSNTYYYFDIGSWERRIFRETHILQPNKFMTEEELTAL